ncbi:hypothetical protein MNBD_GAMMA21-275 [hydrothermal vent metagenome]|uniref:Flagellar brake protein YcgR n=1 Tax=hydrothermal vent metagenome TaxID=652676 RepID=A0A3B1ARA3_9ZZZZ
MTDSLKSRQTISYTPHIVNLLHRLQASRSLVKVKIGKDSLEYNSIILDAKNDSREFYLDELNSPEGHKKIRKGTLVHVDGRLEGVRIQFQTQVSGIENDNSIAMYRLVLPTSMLYQQRRRHYRAHVNGDQKLAISLPVPLKHHVVGDIVDLSASGFCSRLDYSDSINFQAEQAIYSATLNLPGRNEITCDIEVRSVRAYPDKGYALIGSRFLEIQPNQQTHLERIVAMLDRNQRRTVSY